MKEVNHLRHRLANFQNDGLGNYEEFVTITRHPMSPVGLMLNRRGTFRGALGLEKCVGLLGK
jgi:hypothetical protein